MLVTARSSWLPFRSFHTIEENLSKFFASANWMLNSMIKPKENVLIHLLYTNCVPRLTYGAAIKECNSSEKQQLNVAVNNAVRRIFGFRRWQSIHQIREFYGYKPIEIMFEKAHSKFVKHLPNHRNGTQFLSILLE